MVKYWKFHMAEPHSSAMDAQVDKNNIFLWTRPMRKHKEQNGRRVGVSRTHLSASVIFLLLVIWFGNSILMLKHWRRDCSTDKDISWNQLKDKILLKKKKELEKGLLIFNATFPSSLFISFTYSIRWTASTVYVSGLTVRDRETEGYSVTAPGSSWKGGEEMWHPCLISMLWVLWGTQFCRGHTLCGWRNVPFVPRPVPSFLIQSPRKTTA